MAAIGLERARRVFVLRPSADGWASWAAEVRGWLAEQGVEPREATLLLPFAAHLPLARQAWLSAGGGWLPRIETTRTLAQSLGSALPAAAGELSGEPAVDRLVASGMLAGQAWGREWRRRDARGFELAVGRLVETAQALVRAAVALTPGAREPFWAQARELTGARPGPGGRERALAALAVEWAAQAPRPQTDVLFGWSPGAWVATSAVELEPLARGLLEHAMDAGIPVLWLDAGGGVSHEVEAGRVTMGVARDLEDEAQRAAACIARCVDATAAAGGAEVLPVALVAQDRGLVRRVRALLERAQLSVADETGWKLSTTRAAAVVMAWLRAARPQATSDEWLAALKDRASWVGCVGTVADEGAAEAQAGRTQESRLPGGDAVEVLERVLRRRGWTHAWRLGEQAWGDSRDEVIAHGVWATARDVLSDLQRRGPLLEAVQGLRLALERAGIWSALLADPAGSQVLAALRLDASDSGVAWLAAAGGTVVDLEGLIRWADDVLEQVVFSPLLPVRPDVVLTPMARAVLRPFSAVVWPGVDDAHLGEPDVPQGLLPESAAAALGLPTRVVLREQQWRAFQLLMGAGEIHLSWRESDAERPLGPSPLLERWALDHAAAAPGAAPWQAARDWRDEVEVTAHATPHPLPRLEPGVALPRRLHATAYEALRACPYRFHAEVLLGLREDEELEEGVDKRDYGTWLHAVLRRYHAGDDPASAFDAEAELARLMAVAEEVQAETWGTDTPEARAAFLPFAAAFERMAQAYIAWWSGRRERGDVVQAMEQRIDVEPEELSGLGVALTGQLDRVDDSRGEDGAEVWRILDYKTTAKGRLQDRVKPPTEDTQLAFYAALLALREVPQAPELAAIYLALEDREVCEVAHPDVQATAEALLGGLEHDMRRIQAGVPMQALGEGAACEYCRARGLCRRDHWPQEPAAQVEPEA